MIIKNRPVFVYDIEIFPNVFHNVVKNTETGQYIKFEISERRNDLDQICKFFHLKDKDSETDAYLLNDKIFCGYNNKHYDDVIINYLIDYQYIMTRKSWWEIVRSLFNLSQCIIQEDTLDRWKRWKYLNCFDSVDLLTMRFSSKLRVGLKEILAVSPYTVMYKKNWEKSVKNICYCDKFFVYLQSQ